MNTCEMNTIKPKKEALKPNNSVIKLNKDYTISSDDLNLTLHKCMVVTSEKSKKLGEEYFPVIGYYSTIEGLLKGLIQKQINIEVKQQETLESVSVFEVGDDVVAFGDPDFGLDIFKFEDWMHDYIDVHLRHATPEEIKAGYRL